MLAKSKQTKSDTKSPSMKGIELVRSARTAEPFASKARSYSQRNSVVGFLHLKIIIDKVATQHPLGNPAVSYIKVIG